MFDVAKYLNEAVIDPALLESAEGRRELTRIDPLLFAIIYLPEHITDEYMGMTFSEFHLDLVAYAQTFVKPLNKPMEYRDAFIAPRECGKSTWLFLIIPMWAAAHGYVKFVAAFSETASQAQGHLLSFKRELDQNEYLQNDFPTLCAPAKVAQTGRAFANNNNRIVQENGFIFAASGADVSNHGIKVGNQRPDFIILDDIEPGESNYSDYEMKKRRNTIWDDIAPMNIRARLVFVGTTQMPNSIIDQLRKYSEFPEDEELKWVKEQNIKVHYWPAILTDDSGAERSVWPEKWPIEWLTSKRHTRDFAKNYMNRPISSDGHFWEESDILVDEEHEYGNTILSIDPAVTKGKVSDYTGIAVLSRSGDKIVVRFAGQFKMSGQDLAVKVAELVETYDVGLIYCETNQGGDLWRDVFKSVPAKYRSVHSSPSKEVRAGKALNAYQQGKVVHAGHFPVLVEQMLSFPKIAHDDVVDAVVSGVLYFTKPAVRVTAKQIQYV